MIPPDECQMKSLQIMNMLFKAILKFLPTVLDYLNQCFSKVSHLAPQGGICKLKGGKIVKGGM